MTVSADAAVDIASTVEGLVAALETAERQTRAAAPLRATAMSIASRHVAPAQVLAGRYLVLDELGRGAMGVVHRAYDTSVGREVAVKVLQTEDVEAQAKLVREARAMAKLANPHVVAVYDVVPVEPERGLEHGGRVLLVMQCVPGESLQAWLKRERSAEDVLAMFRQAGQGLLAAHEAGLVHRDFKPANVLIADDVRALVTDFGIAGNWSGTNTRDPIDGVASATMAGRIVGTPWYMPPEQHLGMPVDPRADQYAFCVSLWEALAGAPIFADISDVDSLLARKHEPLPAWPVSVAVPPKVVSALLRGLSTTPEERFPSMAELLVALAADERRSSVPMIVATACTAVAASAFVWSWQAERAKQCSGADEHMRGVWDDAKRETIRNSLLATGVGYAADTASRVQHELDEYANAWTEQHRTACEATTVRDEQSAVVMDLRMACLYRARVDLQAVTDLLAQADAPVVENAQRVTSGLPALERCADIEALQVDIPPPDPADVDAVKLARARLAAVNVLLDAGKYNEAQTAALALTARADALGYGPLQTEVWLVLGIAHHRAGAYAEGEATFKRALRSGLRWKQRVAAQDAAGWLVEVNTSPARAVEAFAYAATAQALLLPGDALADAELRSRIGLVLRGQARWSEAEAAHRAALKQLEAVLGPDDPRLTIVRADIAVILQEQGRHAEVEREQRDILRRRESTLGPEHPDVGITRLNLAGLLSSLGRYEEAQQECLAATNLLEKALGPEHPHVGIARHIGATIALSQGAHARSEVEERLALAVLAKTSGSDHPVITSARQTLAIALLGLGRSQEAEAELRSVLALQTKQLGPEHPDVALSLMHLGNVLLRQGRLEEAEAEHRAALRLREKALEPGHPDLAESRKALADVLTQQRRAERNKAP